MRSEIVFILDVSASMEDLKRDAIRGFNMFVDEQKRVPGGQLTLVEFSDPYDIRVQYEGLPLEKVEPMRAFNSGGMTALLDAVGSTIEKSVERFKHTLPAETPAKVVVAIMTDGDENASVTYDFGEVRRMVEFCRDQLGWEFIIFSSDHSVWSLADRLGIDREKVHKYVAVGEGMRLAYESLSRIAIEYRES